MDELETSKLKQGDSSMFMTIVFWVSCVIAYLYIGTTIGQVSFYAWENFYPADNNTPLKRLVFLLCFPGTSITEDTDYPLPLLTKNEMPREAYVAILAFIWPLKFAWNLVVLTIYGIIMLCAVLLKLLSLPFDAIRARLTKKRKPKILPMPVRVPTYGELLARKREELETTRAKALQLEQEISGLEGQMVKDQGGSPMRASESVQVKKSSQILN